MNITLQGASSTNHLQTEHTNEEKKKLVIDGSSLLGKQEEQKKEEQIEESQKEDDMLQEQISTSAQEVLNEVQKLFGDEPLDEDLKGLIIDTLS